MKRPLIYLFTGLTLSGIALAAMAQTAGSDAIAAAIFERLDADKDGQISTAEMTTHKAAQFAKADGDDNGLVDAAELLAIRDRMAKMVAKSGTPATASLTKLDRDGDNALSLAEYTAQTPIFTLLDADGDGAISRAEFDRARAAFAN